MGPLPKRTHPKNGGILFSEYLFPGSWKWSAVDIYVILVLLLLVFFSACVYVISYEKIPPRPVGHILRQNNLLQRVSNVLWLFGGKRNLKMLTELRRWPWIRTTIFDCPSTDIWNYFQSRNHPVYPKARAASKTGRLQKMTGKVC